MTFLKSTLALLGMTVFLAACETGTSSGVPATTTGPNAADFVEMAQVFDRYAPIPFKPMQITQLRAQLKAAGYVKSGASGSTEIWRGVYTRGGKNLAAGRVSVQLCKGSTLVEKTRVTLDRMSKSLATEVLGFVRARKNLALVDERQTQSGQKLRFVLLSADRPEGRTRVNVPRGQFIYSLGGLRIFDNGQRRIGISTYTSCR